MADLLLVDNDPRITELLGWFLERAGHTVRTAASYHAARAALRERAPDLMLADLELGAERGEEELPALAREGGLPPTLVVSGFLDPGLEARLGELPGVLGAVAKPFDLEGLRARIDAHLAELPGAGLPGGAELPAGADRGGTPAAPAGAGGAAPGDDDGWIEIVPDPAGPGPGHAAS